MRRKINYLIYINSIIMGFLVSEVYEILTSFNLLLFLRSLSFGFRLLVMMYVILLYCVIIDFKIYKKIFLIITSKRFDVFFSIVIGGYVSSKTDIFLYFTNNEYFNENSIKSYYSLFLFLEEVNRKYQFTEIFYLLYIVPIIYAYFHIRNFISKRKKTSISNFLSDSEVSSFRNDSLNLSDEAIAYGEKIWNNNSMESLVFGLDAPWGTGKSSFINLSTSYLKEKYKNKIIIYKFTPSQYKDKENVINLFSRGLIEAINDNIYIPELSSIITNYSKILSSTKSSLKLFGVNIEFSNKNDTLQTIYSRLENIMSHINRKIIIVIDDLDRLDFLTIKDIVLVLQKGFTLSNMTFILCYDTDNISTYSSNEHKSEEISVFLEKYITIKTSLFIESEILCKYFIKTYDLALSKNLLSDSIQLSYISRKISDIYESSDFYRYRPFLSNIRKVKRLINCILMLDLLSIDFDNWDIDLSDLIHLLLIYINYPNIFRTIYDSETCGKSGIFSLKKEISLDKKAEYENHEDYNKYKKECTENEVFLLDKVFSANSLTKLGNEIVSKACINGTMYNPTIRNLEKYLLLIINNQKPISTDENRFYTNKRDQISAGKKSLEEILWKDKFDAINGPDIHSMLFRVIANSSPNDFNIECSNKIINYFSDNINKYPLIRVNDSFSFRYTIIRFFIIIIDKIGWYDEREQRSNNIEENVIKIASLLFKASEEQSILERIFRSEKNIIIGFFNLLSFRVSCCINRGGSTHNLFSALLVHSDPNKKLNGNTSELVIDQMRYFSQLVYHLFKRKVINKNINIFKEMLLLDREYFMGMFSEYFESKYSIDELNKLILKERYIILSFIIYQLSNNIISQGIGCGYYKVHGEKHTIQKEMNEYIFNQCFNNNDENYLLYFIIYLLRFESSLSFESEKIIFNSNYFENEIKKEVDIKYLIDFWQINHIPVKDYDLNSIEYWYGKDELYLKSLFNYLDSKIEI